MEQARLGEVDCTDRAAVIDRLLCRKRLITRTHGRRQLESLYLSSGNDPRSLVPYRPTITTPRRVQTNHPKDKFAHADGRNRIGLKIDYALSNCRKTCRVAKFHRERWLIPNGILR